MDEPPLRETAGEREEILDSVQFVRGFCHGAHDAVVSSEWQYGAMTKRADGQPAEKASRRKEFCIANYHVSLDAEKRL